MILSFGYLLLSLSKFDKCRQHVKISVKLYIEFPAGIKILAIPHACKGETRFLIFFEFKDLRGILNKT